MMEPVKGFWHASARNDTAGIDSMTSGPKPLAWARRIAAAYPNFLDTTKDRLAVQYGYYTNAAKDTAIVQLEVPWVSCPPPAHTGSRDKYFVMLAPSGKLWRLVDVWSEPC